MPTYTFTQPNNLSQLHDEILAAVPGTQPVGEGDARTPVMHIEGRDDTIRITVPEGVSEAEIAAVVQAHVPRRRQRHKLASEYRDEYATATQARKLQIIARLAGLEQPDLVDE
jgi:hypothetical protein